MVTKIYGTTGVDKIVDGAITSSDFAAGVGGKILQVVSTTKTDTWSSGTIHTFNSITNLSATITPSSTGSKILILVHMSMSSPDVTSIRVDRDGSTFLLPSSTGSRYSAHQGGIQVSGDGNKISVMSINLLDSPSTTSSVTYQVKERHNSGTVYVNRTPSDNDANYTARSTSTITIMEVAE